MPSSRPTRLRHDSDVTAGHPGPASADRPTHRHGGSALARSISPTAAKATPPPRRLRLFELIATRQWIPVAGYAFYVALLSAGYYYNLTFSSA